MKMRRERLDNKGAALVTILIAVTFMTIMASSLMYMAYMNYLTKSMRYSSTDNFYTDEFALDELSTALQQTAANESTMAAARQAILNGVGKTSRNGHNAYTESDVASLIQVASQEASISVNCAYMQGGSLTEDSLEEGTDYIKLRGVMITATTPEGYQSTITSDIIISFPNTLPGTMDINDFSVLTDSPMVFNTGGSRYYSGNMFVHDPSGGTALRVSNGTVVGLLSPQAMIIGDVVVEENCVLHVTGSLIVYGEIKVEQGGTLICSGEIKHEGDITNYGTIKGISPGDYAGQTLERSEYLNNLPSGTGVVGSLFRDVKVWGTPVDGGSPQWFDFNLEMFEAANINVTHQGDASGVKTHVFGQPQTINTGNTDFEKYSNSLILSTRDVIYNVSMTLPNTTIMTTGSITYLTTQGTSYMSKMSDEAFETAKNYLFRPEGTTQLNPYDGSGYPNVRVYFPVHGDGNYTTNDYNLDDFPGSNKTTVDGYTFAHDDDLSQPMNYLPIYYFLEEDTSSIISEIFAAPTGTANPKNSTIIYELWSKD